MTPTTAIITRTKNRPLLLKRAIEGILAQSSENWVHVIVNDGGNRHEVDTLANTYSTEYQGRLKIVHNGTSVGMEAASNIGIRQSNSEFILIHDDDDSLDSQFLSRTAAYLENPPFPTIRGVCTQATLVHEQIDGENVEELGHQTFRELSGCLSFNEIAGINPVPPISFLFSRDVYKEIGAFDESLPVLGDWEFLLRYICNYDVGVIPETLANYHVRRKAKGDLANSINVDNERFVMLTKIIRNKFLRDSSRSSLHTFIQGGESRIQLERLYHHAVIGPFIRFWSKYINHGIPDRPE